MAAVWLPTPSFAGFLAGGVLTGVGAGLAFKGAVAAAELAPDDRRAEVLAGLSWPATSGRRDRSSASAC